MSPSAPFSPDLLYARCAPAQLRFADSDKLPELDAAQEAAPSSAAVSPAPGPDAWPDASRRS